MNLHDQQANCFFNAINNKAPSDTVMEDTDTDVSTMMQMLQNVIESFGGCIDQV